MSLALAVPAPHWVQDHPTPEHADHAKIAFLVRLAALYHNESGSLPQLSEAIGLSKSGLHMALKRGGLTPENAIAIEQLIGRALFPREHFRPDLYEIPTE